MPHPSVTHLLQYFSYEHLPDFLQKVSKQFCELAQNFSKQVLDSPEKTMTLRKLLEAKDCAVRAALVKRSSKHD